IREALNRLLSDGLVDFEPGRGFFCRKLNIVEVANLFEVRSDLELAAAITACKIAPIEKIEALLNKCKMTKEQRHIIDTDDLVKIDEQFHFDVASLSENNERIKYLKNINAKIRFVRQINLETQERRSRFTGDHVEIVEAIYERDIDKTANLIKKHLGTNSEELKTNIRDGLDRIYGNEIGLH